MVSPEEIRKKRFEFLYKLYEKTEGSEEKGFSIFTISKELGFSYELTETIFQYLQTEGLIRLDVTRAQTNRTIAITHRGIMEVEQALSKPDAPTEHFPPNIIYIGNVGGDVIGVGVTGSDNVIGKNITINKQRLQYMPPEYAESLRKFMEQLSPLFNSIPPEQSRPIQDSLNDFTKEVEGIKPEEKVSTVKQKSLNSRFSIFAEKVLKVLPKTAETVTAFTPLAPFSKLIGEGVQQLVEAIQKDV